jgi:hypothetical protein
MDQTMPDFIEFHNYNLCKLKKNQKLKNMKKSIILLMLVTTGFFCSGQNSTDSVYTGTMDSVKAKVVIKGEDRDSSRAGLAKAIETGTIYNSTSPHHNILHEFTYLVAMRDYCNKTILQMRDNGEVNKDLSKKLEKELSKAKTELTLAKFNGLKIESDYYELILKQIKDRFKD